MYLVGSWKLNKGPNPLGCIVLWRLPDKRIFFNHFLELMRLIYAVFILLLALMTSAQCQQTEEPSLQVREELGPYSMSFSTPIIDKVIQLPEEKKQTDSGLKYTSYGLELYDSSGMSLGNIIVTQFVTRLAYKESDTRKKELGNILRDRGCTKIKSQDIKVDSRDGMLVVCESNNVCVFEYRISSSTTVMGVINLPWNDNTKTLLDTLQVKKK